MRVDAEPGILDGHPSIEWAADGHSVRSPYSAEWDVLAGEVGIEQQVQSVRSRKVRSILHPVRPVVAVQVSHCGRMLRIVAVWRQRNALRRRKPGRLSQKVSEVKL